MTHIQGHQRLSGTVRLFIPWSSEQPWMTKRVPDGANHRLPSSWSRVCREVGRGKCQRSEHFLAPWRLLSHLYFLENLGAPLPASLSFIRMHRPAMGWEGGCCLLCDQC